MTTSSKGGLTHTDSRGHARMVDVSGKPLTKRVAVAEGRIRIGEKASVLVAEGSAPKGDVAAAARIAAILAVKRTPELIPLCHVVGIDSVQVDVNLDGCDMTVRCTVSGTDRTGFEMEALTGVSVGLLVIYDMLKAVDRGMVIGPVRVLGKSGGASGEYKCRE